MFLIKTNKQNLYQKIISKHHHIGKIDSQVNMTINLRKNGDL